MRLARVRIRNFRSIEDVTIRFEPRFRILVGINESGKSNVLAALSLLDADTEIEATDIREFGPREDREAKAFIHFVFALDDEDRTAIFQNFRKRCLSPSPNTHLVVMDGKMRTCKSAVAARKEGVYIADLRSRDKRATSWVIGRDSTVARGWYKPAEACPEGQLVGGTNVKLAGLSLVHESFVRDVPEGYIEEATAADVSSALSASIGARVEEELPQCLYWSYSDEDLLPPKIPLAEFTADPSTCVPLQTIFSLAGISDIKKTLQEERPKTNGLRNLLNRVADAATRHVRNAWKEYKGVSIALYQNGDHIEASVRDHFNHYDFSRRSDGFKRFVSFLLMVSAQAKTDDLVDTLYLHDEPDTGLHPSGTRYLRDELIKLSLENYVVVSTHSIFMIDNDRIDRHLIVKREREVTSIEQVDESNIADEEVIYNALGTSIFQLLKKTNLVFEGWRDKQLFKIALNAPQAKNRKLASKFADVGLCHAKGVKDVRRVAPMLQLAQRYWIVISDADRPALEQQKIYDGEGPWFRYDELLPGHSDIVTGEDFVKPAAFVRATQQLRSEHPELGALDPEVLRKGPRLAALKAWLASGALTIEEKKDAVDRIKAEIFDKLRPDQIEDSYFSLMKELSVRLKRRVA